MILQPSPLLLLLMVLTHDVDYVDSKNFKKICVEVSGVLLSKISTKVKSTIECKHKVLLNASVKNNRTLSKISTKVKSTIKCKCKVKCSVK